MLTISVKNFGPIAEGSVDLRPLTIFVGPSNTGKSYMATAVYAVMRGFEGRRYAFKIRYSEYDDYRAAFENIVESMFALEDEEIARKEFSVSRLPAWIRSQIEESTQTRLKALQRNIIVGLRNVLGISESQNDLAEFQVNLRRDVPPLDVSLVMPETNSTAPELSISEASVSLAAFDLSPPFPDKYEDDQFYGDILDSMDDGIERLVLSELPFRSYFLPAARSGIVIGHKLLTASLIRSTSRLGTSDHNYIGIPPTVTDFLSDLVSLDGRMAATIGRKEFTREIKFIETQVLQGRVDIDESGGLPFPDIVYLPTTGGQQTDKFTLDQTSSMVSELAPLILFLKYLVNSGDLLILEEPESHLHPAAQRQLARGIVRLVNAGVKVLITTHSDIMISQINNLLALRQASPELVESGGFEPEDFLQPDQVGAYLFRYNQELGGCETVELEIDPDTGIDEDEFAAVFEGIYNESIALQRDRN